MGLACLSSCAASETRTFESEQAAARVQAPVAGQRRLRCLAEIAGCDAPRERSRLALSVPPADGAERRWQLFSVLTKISRGFHFRSGFSAIPWQLFSVLTKSGVTIWSKPNIPASEGSKSGVRETKSPHRLVKSAKSCQRGCRAPDAPARRAPAVQPARLGCFTSISVAVKIADRGKNFNLWAHKLKFLPHLEGRTEPAKARRPAPSAKPQVRKILLRRSYFMAVA